MDIGKIKDDIRFNQNYFRYSVVTGISISPDEYYHKFYIPNFFKGKQLYDVEFERVYPEQAKALLK